MYFSIQNSHMNFWENVVAELGFQGKTRKELAAEIGFDASNIGKGEKQKYSCCRHCIKNCSLTRSSSRIFIKYGRKIKKIFFRK